MTSHKQAAREIVQQVCDAIREKARQTDWTSESSSDESLSSVWYEHIAAALARRTQEAEAQAVAAVESERAALVRAQDAVREMEEQADARLKAERERDEARRDAERAEALVKALREALEQMPCSTGVTEQGDLPCALTFDGQTCVRCAALASTEHEKEGKR